jgi:hypothetical protein
LGAIPEGAWNLTNAEATLKKRQFSRVFCACPQKTVDKIGLPRAIDPEIQCQSCF